jgi:hypothetical protein
VAELPDVPDEVRDRLTAYVELIGRTGAQETQIRYSDDVQPVIWFLTAKYLRRAHRDAPTLPYWETASALTPDRAALRLAERLVDGGQCTHCRRPTGLSDDWATEQPLSEAICWYVYDPELHTVRRGCEGQ